MTSIKHVTQLKLPLKRGTPQICVQRWLQILYVQLKTTKGWKSILLIRIIWESCETGRWETHYAPHHHRHREQISEELSKECVKINKLTLYHTIFTIIQIHPQSNNYTPSLLPVLMFWLLMKECSVVISARLSMTAAEGNRQKNWSKIHTLMYHVQTVVAQFVFIVFLNGLRWGMVYWLSASECLAQL